MELKVLNKEGKETGRTVVLNDEVFGIEPNDHVIYLAVKQFLADQRRYEKSFYFNGCYHGSVLAACLVVFINCILIDLYY